MRNIERAARLEHDAEQDRSQAEQAWRTAWWETTLALGEATDVTAAYNTATEILGQSRGWMGTRRQLGRAFAGLEGVHKLPPRLSVVYVESKGDPADAVRAITDAETNEISIRDFAATLGVQPKSWQREGERTTADIGSMTVPQRVQAARELLASPEVAKDVFADPDAAGDAVRAAYAPLARAMHDEDRRMYEKAVPPGSAEEKTREREQQAYEVLEVMQRMHQLITATGRLSALGTLSADQTGMIVPLAERTKVAVEYLAALSDSSVSLEDELATILDGER